MTSSNWLTAFVFVFAAYILLRTIERWLAPQLRAERSPYEVTLKRLEEALAAQAREHAASIEKLRVEYEAKIAALQEQVRFLIGELAAARKDLDHRTPGATAPPPTLPAPILLIGGDPKILENDRNALQRAGADFVTVRDATKEEIKRRLQRAREDHKPYRRVHISAHGTDEAIQLADGPATGKWWNDVLVGVEVVFLAACHSSGVGDWLAGKNRAVIEMDSNVEEELAYQFTYLFWRSVLTGRGTAEAFTLARSELPAIADQVSVRIRSEEQAH